MSLVETRLHLDRTEGKIIAERVQDVAPILDRNHALRGEAQRSDWGRHVASVPCVILERWLNEELERGNTSIRLFSAEMDALVARKLQDPDWKWLRADK